MCSTILAAPDESMTKNVNETVMNSTTINMSVNSTILGAKQSLSSGHKTTDQLLEKMDMARLRRAGAFLSEPECKVFLSGFNEHQQELLRRCIKSAAATIMNQLTQSVTHVIVSNTLPLEHAKIAQKLKLNPHFVSVQWLIESMQMGMAVPESDFPMQKATDPPLRGENLSIDKCKTNCTNEVTVTDDQMEDDIMAQYGNATATAMLLPPNENVKEQFEEKGSPDPTISFKVPPNIRHVENNIGLPNKENPDGTYCETKNSANCEMTSNNCEADEHTQMTEADTQVERFLLDKKLAILGFEEEPESEISEWIQEAGGEIIFNDFDGIVDYLVVPAEGYSHKPLKYKSRNVVSNYWLEDCVEKGELVEFEYYHFPINFDTEAKPCNGAVIGITGYAGRERSFIISIAQALGMVAQEIFAKRDKKGALRSTHLICASPEGAKYDAGIKWDLPVVTKDWLRACLKDAEWVCEKPFLVGEATRFTVGKLMPRITPIVQSTDEEENKAPSPSNSPQPANLRNPTIAISDYTNGDSSNQNINFKTPQSTRASIAAALETPGTMGPDIENTRPRPLDFTLTPSADEVTPARGVPESQPSPANLKRKREEEEKQYKTPYFLKDVKTPETPYGAFLGKNPSKDERKYWKLQCDQMGRFEFTAEQRKELEEKRARINQFVQKRQNERETVEKEFEEYVKHALDPERTKQMHIKTFEKCGVPIIGKDGKTFDELMEEKMQKQGLSWKNPSKRFKLSTRRDEDLSEDISKGIFQGVIVYVTKKLESQQGELQAIVASLGGDYRHQYRKEVTHVIFQVRTQHKLKLMSEAEYGLNFYNIFYGTTSNCLSIY